MVIFSDGEDAEVIENGKTIDDVLQDAVKAKIPVYFVRISKGNTKLPDEMWQRAIEDRRPVLHRRRRGGDAARDPRHRPGRHRHGRGARVQQPGCRGSRRSRWPRRRCGCWRAALRLLAPHSGRFRRDWMKELRVMRSAVGYLVVALVLFVGGRVLFGGSSLEQRTADAEQALLTLRYGDLDATTTRWRPRPADRAPLPRRLAGAASRRSGRSSRRRATGWAATAGSSPSATPPAAWPKPTR